MCRVLAPLCLLESCVLLSDLLCLWRLTFDWLFRYHVSSSHLLYWRHVLASHWLFRGKIVFWYLINLLAVACWLLFDCGVPRARFWLLFTCHGGNLHSDPFRFFPVAAGFWILGATCWLLIGSWKMCYWDAMWWLLIVFEVSLASFLLAVGKSYSDVNCFFLCHVLVSGWLLRCRLLASHWLQSETRPRLSI